MEELYGECPYSCEHSVQSVSESCCFCCVGVRCPNNGLTESDSDDGHDQSKSDYRCCLGGQRLNSEAKGFTTVVDRLVGTALFPPLSLSLFILSWFSTVCRLCRPLFLFGFLQSFAPLTTGHFLVSTSKHRCSASDHNGNSGRLNCPPLDLSAGASGSERVWKGLLHLRPASHLHWPTAHHKRSFITGDHVRSISLPIFLIVTGRAFLSFALSIQRTLKPSPMQAAYYLRTSACSNCAALLIGSMPPSAKASHLHAQQTPKPRWNCRGDNCSNSSSRCLKHPMNNSINSSSCCCLLGALWSLGPSLSFVAFEATTSKRQTMQHLSFIFDIKAPKQSLNRKPEDNC